MGERRNSYKMLVGKPEVKKPLARLGVNRLVVLKWTLKTWNEGVWTGFMAIR
jgi:hypothetical protein